MDDAAAEAFRAIFNVLLLMLKTLSSLGKADFSCVLISLEAAALGIIFHFLLLRSFKGS